MDVHVGGGIGTTGVHEHASRTDIVYLEFIPATGHGTRAFADNAFHDLLVLALQRGPDTTWRASGLVDHWPREAQPEARDT